MTRFLSPIAGLLASVLSSLPSPATAESYDEARAYARSTGGLCLLIQRGQRLLVEDYAEGCSPRTDHRIYSIAKNLWALAAAALHREGALDFDEPASETLLEWRETDKERITLRELLSMTGGLPSAGRTIYGDDSSYAADALRQPLKIRPGSGFNYGAASMEAFGEFLRRRLAQRGETPENYLERQILRPNGITLRTLKRDRTGGLMYSSGIRTTPPNLLRLGRAVLAAAHQPEARLLFQGSKANPSYGLTFWLNPFAQQSRVYEPDIEEALVHWPAGTPEWRRVCLASAAPRDLITMLGSRGQRVYVVPSTQTIIVRLADGGAFRDAEFWRRMPGS